MDTSIADFCTHVAPSNKNAAKKYAPAADPAYPQKPRLTAISLSARMYIRIGRQVYDYLPDKVSKNTGTGYSGQIRSHSYLA